MNERLHLFNDLARYAYVKVLCCCIEEGFFISFIWVKLRVDIFNTSLHLYQPMKVSNFCAR